MTHVISLKFLYKHKTSLFILFIMSKMSTVAYMISVKFGKMERSYTKPIVLDGNQWILVVGGNLYLYVWNRSKVKDPKAPFQHKIYIFSLNYTLITLNLNCYYDNKGSNRFQMSFLSYKCLYIRIIRGSLLKWKSFTSTCP